jgi:hypothetical protein
LDETARRHVCAAIGSRLLGFFFVDYLAAAAGEEMKW